MLRCNHWTTHCSKGGKAFHWGRFRGSHLVFSHFLLFKQNTSTGISDRFLSQTDFTTEFPLLFLPLPLLFVIFKQKESLQLFFFFYGKYVLSVLECCQVINIWICLLPLTLGAHVNRATYCVWCLNRRETKPEKQRPQTTQKTPHSSPQATKGGLTQALIFRSLALPIAAVSLGTQPAVPRLVLTLGLCEPVFHVSCRGGPGVCWRRRLQGLAGTAWALGILCYVFAFCAGSPCFSRWRCMCVCALVGLFTGRDGTKENRNGFNVLWFQWKQIKKHLSTEPQPGRAVGVLAWEYHTTARCALPQRQRLGRVSRLKCGLLWRTKSNRLIARC